MDDLERSNFNAFLGRNISRDLIVGAALHGRPFMEIRRMGGHGLPSQQASKLLNEAYARCGSRRCHAARQECSGFDMRNEGSRLSKCKNRRGADARTPSTR